MSEPFMAALVLRKEPYYQCSEHNHQRDHVVNQNEVDLSFESKAEDSGHSFGNYCSPYLSHGCFSHFLSSSSDT